MPDTTTDRAANGRAASAPPRAAHATAPDPVALAQALVRCPSVTPAEGGALGVLERALRPLGFACERMDFSAPGTPDVANLWARIGRTGKHFCFAGHVDVVPVGDRAAWTVDPFAGEIAAGALWGRGAADMKGAIGAFAAAAGRFLARRGPDFGGSISFMITGDEEGPAVNGTAKMLRRLAERGETVDLCVVGEPTSARRLGDMAKIGRRGSVNVVLTVQGVQGHVAYPERVDNPVHRLARMVEALLREPIDSGSAHFPPSSLQVTTFDVGNATTNLVPARATARFNVRFNDLWDSARLLESLRARLEAAHAACGGVGAWSMEPVVSGESFLTPPGELSELVVGAVRDILGVEPELSTTGGTSDARFIRAACPVVEFGAVGETMHAVDERCAVADIEALSRIYEAMLDRCFPA